jgi:hypothetical protein
MPGPPEDVSPSDLWAKLAEPRPSQVVDFPRRDAKGAAIGKVRIQVLRMEDHDTARIRAHESLKRKAQFQGLQKLEAADMESPAMQAVLGDLSAREILCLACLSDKPTPDTADSDAPFYPRLFKDPDALASRVTADEMAVLFSAYQMVQRNFGPFEKTFLTKEDLDAWIVRLMEALEKEDPLAIARLSLPQLVEVITSLSVRLYGSSAILRSQWSSLPSTLASGLDRFCLDMSCFGARLADDDQAGSERSPENDGETPADVEREPVGIPTDRAITIEEAARVLEKLKPGSG